MLCLFERLPLLADLKFEISDLKSHAEGVSKQIRAWADSLQNSDIKGQRYLNDNTRRRTRNIKEREDFLEELRQIRANHGRTSDK